MREFRLKLSQNPPPGASCGGSGPRAGLGYLTLDGEKEGLMKPMDRMRAPLVSAAALVVAMGSSMAAAEIMGETVSYEIDGMAFEGYVAWNSNLEQSRGTVLIVHDWTGVDDYERRRAEMLAAEGFTAFAIDVYGAEAEPQGFDDFRALSGAMYADREAFRSRLMGGIAAAADLPGAGGPVVMIGYCFGGAAVLEAARAGAGLDGFVSFHGGLDLPEGQDYSAVAAPVMLFHGSADPVSGMADLAALLDDLQAAGVTHDAQVFGAARHSFTVWGSGDYDLRADRESWSGLLRFLDRVM